MLLEEPPGYVAPEDQWATDWSSRSKKTFLMSTPKRPGVQIFRRSALR